MTAMAQALVEQLTLKVTTAPRIAVARSAVHPALLSWKRIQTLLGTSLSGRYLNKVRKFQRIALPKSMAMRRKTEVGLRTRNGPAVGRALWRRRSPEEAVVVNLILR